MNEQIAHFNNRIVKLGLEYYQGNLTIFATTYYVLSPFSYLLCFKTSVLFLGCVGNEASLEPIINDHGQVLRRGCQWDRRKMGSGVCDHHPNIGLRCLPFHHPENRAAHGHWRGLR